MRSRGTVMARSTRELATAMLSAIALVAGCTDSSGPSVPPVNHLPSLIVSSPETPSSGAIASLRHGGAAIAASVVGTAWVSLPPGSVSGGQSATIQNGRSGPTITVSIVDGGFDPAPISANVGDTIFVTAAILGSNKPVTGFQVVAARRIPTIVRTSPPRGATDVPLNAAIVAVFSAPIDTATLNTNSFGLVKGSSPVGGTVRPIGTTGISAEFYPDSVLAPLTNYQLFVTQAIHDVNGEPLAETDTLTFTTAASAPVTGNLQVVISGLPVTGLAAVTVSGPGAFSQIVTASTTLSGLVPGTYVIAALNVWASNSTYGPSPASQTVLVIASTAPAPVTVTYTVIPSGWVSVTGMPTTRWFLAAGAINGILYAVGGATGSGTLDPGLEAYDPATNSWTTKAPMPTPRYGFGVGIVNGVLYAVGGASAGVPLATMEAYDPATNTWTSKAPMPTPRQGLAVGVVGGVLYAVGGYDLVATGQSTVEAYDPATDTWTTKAAMPTARYNLAAGAINGILYAVGGFGSPGGDLATVEAYDPATDTWTSKAAMPTTREALALGVLNGLLYAVGGQHAPPESAGGYALAIMEAYDPGSDSWTTKPPMPTARLALAGCVVSGTLYAVGGETLSSGGLNTVEAYIP